jgi:hypothetical protein
VGRKKDEGRKKENNGGRGREGKESLSSNTFIVQLQVEGTFSS